jgi:uncharacterized membrane protein
VEPELLPADMTPLPFSIGDVLSRSWEIYRDRMGICIGVVMGCGLMNFGAQMVLSFAQQVAPMARNPQAVAAVVGIFGTLGMMLFQIWIGIGQTLVMFDIARGREASFGDVFSGGRYILRVVLASLLFALVIAGVVALGALPGGLIWAVVGRDVPVGPIALGVGIFAGFVVAIILGLRLSQFYYAILDRDAGIEEALRTSLRITRGNAGMIFVIFLLTSAINLAGALACFVGLIFTLPFTALLLIVTYLALTGQSAADPYAKGEPYADLDPL